MFKGVKALTPTSVEVDLTQPWAAFPSSFLTGGSAFMMAPAMISSANGGVEPPDRHRALQLRQLDPR